MIQSRKVFRFIKSSKSKLRKLCAAEKVWKVCLRESSQFPNFLERKNFVNSEKLSVKIFLMNYATDDSIRSLFQNKIYFNFNFPSSLVLFAADENVRQ